MSLDHVFIAPADGGPIAISRKAAMMCGTLRDWLEDAEPDGQATFPVPASHNAVQRTAEWLAEAEAKATANNVNETAQVAAAAAASADVEVEGASEAEAVAWRMPRASRMDFSSASCAAGSQRHYALLFSILKVVNYLDAPPELHEHVGLLAARFFKGCRSVAEVSRAETRTEGLENQTIERVAPHHVTSASICSPPH